MMIRVQTIIKEGRSVENAKSDPIVIEQAGMRMTIAHRKGLGGSDEGLTFDIITAGREDSGKGILRFDCFYKNPHYHVGASGSENTACKMKYEGIDDPVRWTLEQLKTRFPSMVNEAGTRKLLSGSNSKRLPISSRGWSRKYSSNTNWAAAGSRYKIVKREVDPSAREILGASLRINRLDENKIRKAHYKNAEFCIFA
ncbi:MAG: hypothetical protein ACM3SP_26320 [Chloroflexota bacterium]